MRFRKVGALGRGYDVGQVDAFIARALGGGVSSAEIRSVGFDLRLGGYQVSAVDAALDRLEDDALTAEREALYEKITKNAQFAVAVASPQRIDRDNILRASLWALARAVAGLPERQKLVFVDGRDKIAVDCECQAVISGDGLIASIAAASIIAKVVRDRLMTCLGAAHPGYGFERHMGYSVPEHFAALSRLGPTIHHRRSFAPVAEALGLTAAAEADTLL